jgi:hypothetical protein
MRDSGCSLILLFTGCVSTPGVHPTLHPATPGSGPNAGVALGALVQSANDETSTNIGYGEGWARLGADGAFEVRTTPQAAFAAYNLPVVTGETSVALRPSVGVSVLRYSETDATGMKETAMFGTIHPGLALVIQVGGFYAAPRLGFSRTEVLEGGGDDTDGESAYSVAGTIGYWFDDRMSLEVTAVHSRNFDDPAAKVWTVVPSIGITVGGK